MASLPDNGLVHLRSPYSVPETLKRLESVLHAKNLTVFARIDHSDEAAKAGLTMRRTSHHFRKSQSGHASDGCFSNSRH